MVGVNSLRQRKGNLAAFFLLAVVASGCGQTTPPTAPERVSSDTPSVAAVPGPQTLALVAAVQSEATSVQVAEVMRPESFSFFAVVAVRIAVDGENIYAFEYPGVAQAEAEADRISADGGIVGMTHVDWISDPHFYRSGPLVALYVGKTSQVLALLERLLGRQIAGR